MKNISCMKNLSTFLTIMAVALTTVSCRSEMETGNNSEISITVAIPNPIDTYTKAPLASDAFSHLGGAMIVDPSAFDLRYIVEVWSNEETPKLQYRDTQCVDDNFTTTSVLFKIPAQSLPCHLVFWADFVKQGHSEDLHYITDDNLQNICYADDITSVGNLATDDMDAYYAVVPIESISNDQEHNVVLKRPFGKIRLLATDKVDGGEIEGLKPVIASIDFKDEPFANTYNALTGKATADRSKNFTNRFDFNIIQEDALVNDVAYEDVYLLGYDYFFVTDQNPSYALDVTVYGDKAKTFPLATKKLSGIPVVENKLTTVIGNFYSSHGNIKIIVDDKFDNQEIEM